MTNLQTSKAARASSRKSSAQHFGNGEAAPQLACNDVSAGSLYDRYISYLRDEQGLAANSILVYSIHIRTYLAQQDLGNGVVSPRALDAATMRQHILDFSDGRSGEFIRLMGVSLRSFCRFLFVHGFTTKDLSIFIPPVRTWRHASVPTYLTPEQFEDILTATDRSTRTGCRDYAILLLLSKLGLRAGEIVTMSLDDVRWRSSEIVVHGKGQKAERVPLLCDVGDALAQYLREFRQASSSRRLFLSQRPVGLSGPAVIGHIVRRAFARIGFRPSTRGASHLFRHGLATTMIRKGASMTQIAQVMRHRSEVTTAIYAKVAFEDLRQVASPWPTPGGAS